MFIFTGISFVDDHLITSLTVIAGEKTDEVNVFSFRRTSHKWELFNVYVKIFVVQILIDCSLNKDYVVSYFVTFIVNNAYKSVIITYKTN